MFPIFCARSQFLANHDIRLLYITRSTSNASAKLEVSINTPDLILNPAATASDVFFYFMKAPVNTGDDEQLNASMAQPFQFTPAEMEFGLMDAQSLVQLSRFLQEVMLPLSETGSEVWGNLVSNTVNNESHNFVSALMITLGDLKGKMCLPLPDSVGSGEGTEGKAADLRERLHILEGEFGRQILLVHVQHVFSR